LTASPFYQIRDEVCFSQLHQMRSAHMLNIKLNARSSIKRDIFYQYQSQGARSSRKNLKSSMSPFIVPSFKDDSCKGPETKKSATYQTNNTQNLKHISIEQIIDKYIPFQNQNMAVAVIPQFFIPNT